MKRISLFLICLFIVVYPSLVMGKERLVLMPVQGKGVDPGLKPMMASAVAEGLSTRYEVLFGRNVEEKIKEIYQKISEETAVGQECDEKKCLQEVGMEFQAELIATVKVLKRQSGYLLALNILNAYEDSLVYSRSEPCEGCNEFRVIDVLKIMAGGKPSVPVATPAPEKPVPPPKKEEKRSTDGRYIDYGDGTITDSETNLMWTRKDSHADLGKCIDWNDSKSYVKGLNTGGYRDWRLPTVKELKTIYEKSKSNYMAYDSKYSLHLDSIFGDGAAYGYWSSEEMGSCCARGVDFDHGGITKYTRSSCAYQGVRAVRR